MKDEFKHTEKDLRDEFEHKERALKDETKILRDEFKHTELIGRKDIIFYAS